MRPKNGGETERKQQENRGKDGEKTGGSVLDNVAVEATKRKREKEGTTRETKSSNGNNKNNCLVAARLRLVAERSSKKAKPVDKAR